FGDVIFKRYIIESLLEQDEDRRRASVFKAMRTVDNFVDPYPRDGGCDEGPSYWGRAGASLYDCLELLRSATGGEIDVYADPLVQNIGKFIYRVQIHDRYFINFADAPAQVSPSPALVYGYGKRINDPQMMALGAWSALRQNIAENGLFDNLGRQLPAFSILNELLHAPADPPLLRDTWLPDIQVMVARDTEGSSKGLFVAAKGGNNDESHNHNDIGNVVVYIQGKPVLVDAGVESYTAKTFSSTRYDIWTMQSAYHTLPTINGFQQSPGPPFCARNAAHTADDQKAELTLDIAPSYPEEADINTWVRRITLNRGQDIRITDTYDLKAVTGDLILNLVTACEVALESPGHLALKERVLSEDRTSGTAHIYYDADKLTAFTEEIPIQDARLKPVWGGQLNRILLTANDPLPKDTWTLRITP
ncbi:MAG: heparinase II/III family protein, partial [bacterium]|nr:heparinase II/III family protein [bacterium]